MACLASNNIANGVDMLVNATYFVDSQFGNDSTAVPRNMSLPYQTIGAVLALIQPGEVVYVQPGTYSAPALTLNFSTWYFSQGSTITTNVSGNGFIYGYGNFIGQSPAITCGLGDLVFYGQSVSTPSGEAIRINGSFRSTINIRYLTAETGIYIRGPCFTEINVDKFESEGTFLRTNDSSSGWIYGQYQNIETGRLIRSDSGSISMNLDFQNVISYAPYMLDIEDDVGSIPNTALYNIRIGKVNCVGLLNSSGIGGVVDLHQQPNINLDIQYINSRITDVNPIIVCSTSQVRLTYDTFAFSCFQPVPFIIVVTNGAVLQIHGGKTYNYNTLNTDVGFIRVSSGTFSSFKGNFTELILTSQMLECNGDAETELNISVLNANCQLPRSISCIVNNAKCIVNVQKMFTIYPAESYLIENNGDMHFNVDEWQTFSIDSYMIRNTARLQTKISYLILDGQTNTIIYHNGFMLGFTAGEIRMNGNNNTALLAAGLTFMNIDQILSNNTGNSGIRVQDSGILYGHVSQIKMIDQNCIQFAGSEGSNFTFDSLTCDSGGSVIYVANNNGVINIRGNSIVSDTVEYPIYVISQNTKFNLQLSTMNINSCNAGVYIQSPNTDVKLDIQQFNITTNANLAGIYIFGGNLFLKGDYFMETVTISPLIFVSSESNLKTNLGYVNTSYKILDSRTTGDVWYEAIESITRQLDSNINADLPSAVQKFTIKGYFRTIGNNNLFITLAIPSSIKLLDCIMVSDSVNIVSPIVNIISNYSMGNNGVSGATIIGSFITDGNVG